jgi:hypothetical protein
VINCAKTDAHKLCFMLDILLPQFTTVQYMTEYADAVIFRRNEVSPLNIIESYTSSMSALSIAAYSDLLQSLCFESSTVFEQMLSTNL